MSDASTFTYALLGGILPALLWLAFWLRENKKYPEPKWRIAETFCYGMLAVIFVIPFQKMVADHFTESGLVTFALWAVLEEGFKFLAAWLGGLRLKASDHPIDDLIYLITAALGFAALENTFFLAGQLFAHNILGSVETGGLRFVGSTLLHTAASASIGFALAVSFYKRRRVRIVAVSIGFIFAVLFHTIFNFSMSQNSSLSTFVTFGVVWAAIALLLLAFEKVKTIHRRRIS
jgi:RsiW-degrading membrane proteinase PrsW (M82 family)